MPADPVLYSARREAVIVMSVFLTALCYTVGYCALFGYGEIDPESVLGIPSWVMWGIVAPWMACLAFSAWFSLAFMKDASLADRADSGPGEPHA